jgi:hypothetical protein
MGKIIICTLCPIVGFFIGKLLCVIIDKLKIKDDIHLDLILILLILFIFLPIIIPFIFSYKYGKNNYYYEIIIYDNNGNIINKFQGEEATWNKREITFRDEDDNIHYIFLNTNETIELTKVKNENTIN